MKKHTLSAILAAALLLLSACGGPAQTLDSSISSTQPQSQQEATIAQDLYDLAVQDAADAEESEILPLVTLVPGDDRVTWDSQGRVLLCTWHNYPDSYPPEDTVTIQWGPGAIRKLWIFTTIWRESSPWSCLILTVPGLSTSLTSGKRTRSGLKSGFYDQLRLFTESTSSASFFLIVICFVGQ